MPRLGLWLHGLHLSCHASCQASSVSLVVSVSRDYGLGSSWERVEVCVVVAGSSFSVLYTPFSLPQHTPRSPFSPIGGSGLPAWLPRWLPVWDHHFFLFSFLLVELYSSTLVP